MSADEIGTKLDRLDLKSPLLISNAYLPTSYDLNLNVNHQKPNFTGSATIQLERNPSCTALPDHFEFQLHSNNLVILLAKLFIEGESESKKLKVTVQKESQTIALSAEVPSEEILSKSAKIDISYIGKINQIQTYRDKTYGVFKTNYSDSVEGRSDNYIVATHSQPFGARTIFPCVDEVNVRAPIKLQIQTLAKFKVFSTSPLASQSYIDMTDMALFSFDATPPMPTSTFGFALGDFEVSEEKAGDIPVRFATTRGDSRRVKYALDCSIALLPQLEKLFGVPYPLPKLDIVTLPFFSEGAMENWGMITVIKESVFDFNDPSARAQTRQLLAHQLTHQWIGNLISFDDFKYLWLTEAFATFVGDYALFLANVDAEDHERYDSKKSELVETVMDTDCFYGTPIPSINEYMNSIDTSHNAKTDTIFEKASYDKGMILLNMVATMFQLEAKAQTIQPFFDKFKGILNDHKFKAIKPMDIWTGLNKEVSFDIPSFVHLWIQYPGYPYLMVSKEGDGLKVTQSRYIYDGDAVALQLENSPYHVPLAIRAKKSSGESVTMNILLTDRSTKLNITPEQLISLNCNRQFYYKVVYDTSLVEKLLKSIENNELSSLETIGLLSDYGRVLGQSYRKEEESFFGKHQLLTIISAMNILVSETWKMDYNVLLVALNLLETINNILLHFSKYEEFKIWLDDFSVKLFEKVGSWNKIIDQVTDEYDTREYECRNIILQLAKESAIAQTTARKLYKNLINSGLSKRFVPRELFTSMFNVTMLKANMTEYKQVLALVKNSNVSYLKHTNGLIQELQTAAVSSLAFCRLKELLSKTLHFVNANIDSKMIELALLGFKYQFETSKRELIWDWFKVNYDQWVKKSLRKGSDWAKQIHIALTNISKMMFAEIMHYRREEVKTFVMEKAKLLPPHGLIEIWEEAESDNEEKIAVAKHYDDLVKLLS